MISLSEGLWSCSLHPIHQASHQSSRQSALVRVSVIACVNVGVPSCVSTLIDVA